MINSCMKKEKKNVEKKCPPPMTFDHPLCQTIQLFCRSAYIVPHFKETWRKNENETGTGSCYTT